MCASSKSVIGVDIISLEPQLKNETSGGELQYSKKKKVLSDQQMIGDGLTVHKDIDSRIEGRDRENNSDNKNLLKLEDSESSIAFCLKSANCEDTVKSTPNINLGGKENLKTPQMVENKVLKSDPLNPPAICPEKFRGGRKSCATLMESSFDFSNTENQQIESRIDELKSLSNPSPVSADNSFFNPDSIDGSSLSSNFSSSLEKDLLLLEEINKERRREIKINYMNAKDQLIVSI